MQLLKAFSSILIPVRYLTADLAFRSRRWVFQYSSNSIFTLLLPDVIFVKQGKFINACAEVRFPPNKKIHVTYSNMVYLRLLRLTLLQKPVFL